MILAVMRIPPSLSGHGGSQRAWRLLEALTKLDKVHFVLLGRQFDRDVQSVSLEPVRDLVASVTSIDIPEWQPGPERRLRLLNGAWFNLARMGSPDAPHFSGAAIKRIADQFPVRSCDLLFAGRLPSAVIVDALLRRRLLQSSIKVVDFDDILSRFRERQMTALGAQRLGYQGLATGSIDVSLLKAAERRVAREWDGVSVCTDEDVALLSDAHPGSKVFKVVNVIDRPLLPPPPPSQSSRILFVGNLSFGPNVQGLRTFIDEAWPLVQERCPSARLSIVGLDPNTEVVELAKTHGFSLTANAPDLQPHYQDCDMVIAPILFGSGTRIKILEAMAYGRPVVSTSIGAEGLDLTDGQDILIADTMESFAAAVVRLASDGRLRHQIAAAARALQQRSFAVEAMHASVARFCQAGKVKAAA
jgi:glycosyltransferase involved in cell wall biosynthesis